MTARTARPTIAVRELVKGLVGLAVVLLLGACSADDGASAVPTTTVDASARETTTTAPGTPSTVSPGEQLCGLLGQEDLDALGLGLTLSSGADASGRMTIGSSGAEAACEWFLSTKGASFELSVAIATDVTSADYEEVLAEPAFGDPFTVAGLGEMASAGELPPGVASGPGTVYVLVYEPQRMVQLTSTDGPRLGRDQLVELAKVLLTRI